MIDTDPLSLVFISCFVIGLLYLLISAFIGGLGHDNSHGLLHHSGGDALHHGQAHIGHTHAMNAARDMIHHSHYHTSHHTGNFHFSFMSILSPMSIALFLFGFGFFGYAFHAMTTFLTPVILIFSALAGIVVATLLLMLVSRFFSNSEGTTVQDVSDRTGLIGKVSITIQQGSLGEILYTSPGGMRKSIPARSIDGRRLERDQEVVVVDYQQGVAEVDTWDHFVHQEDSASASLSEEDDLATLKALLEESDDRTSENYIMRNDMKKE